MEPWRSKCAALALIWAVASSPYATASKSPESVEFVRAVADSESLLQVQLSDSARSPAKNLVVFYDGTFQDHTGNAWKIAKHLVQDNTTQMLWYEPGVQDFWGTGVRQHSIRGYKFIAENYNPGDRVFVFGQSRGCLSARYLQGILHRFGLVKRSPSVDWNATFQDHASFENALEEGTLDLDTAVQVEAMGLIDGVLRVLWEKDSPFRNLDMRHMHLELTSTVRSLFHALALEEVADYLQAAELVTDPSTKAEQVWFMGDHMQMCTNNDIMLSWLMDRMTGVGLLVQEDFVASLNLGYTLGSPYRVKIQRDTVIRNPGACRKELYGDSLPNIHISVKDRMEDVRGWKPQTYCCHPEVLREGVSWVSTPTYDLHKIKGPSPQWVVLNLRVSAAASPYPNRFIIAVTDHGNFILDVGAGDIGTLRTTALFPFHVFEMEPRVPGMQPPALIGVEGPCKGPCTGLATFKVKGDEFNVFGGGVLHRGELVADWGVDMVVYMDTELLWDDFGPVRMFHMPLCARCSWLYINTDKRYNGSICPVRLPKDYPSTCEQLRTEATVGSFHSGEAGHFAARYYDEIFRMLPGLEGVTEFERHTQGGWLEALEEQRPFLREDLAATLERHLHE